MDAHTNSDTFSHTIVNLRSNPDLDSNPDPHADLYANSCCHTVRPVCDGTRRYQRLDDAEG